VSTEPFELVYLRLSIGINTSFVKRFERVRMKMAYMTINCFRLTKIAYSVQRGNRGLFKFPLYDNIKDAPIIFNSK
jgi:hypothetical protein